MELKRNWSICIKDILVEQLTNFFRQCRDLGYKFFQQKSDEELAEYYKNYPVWLYIGMDKFDNYIQGLSSNSENVSVACPMSSIIGPSKTKLGNILN